MDIDNNNDEAKYKVYISFDDNDSSISSFTNYLRATFKRHGIFELDDEKDRFFEQLRVLVVVFSSNYKFSVPENIVNRINYKDLVVVPVFHGVMVSSVKQQIELFEPSSSVDQMTMWPRVLLESAVLQAHVYNDERSESKFMEEIARDVFEKLYPTEEIGIHRLQLDIENLLCKQPWGICSLGISGDPGIGKTTLARAIFRRMSCEYDVSCFIKDFHKEYSEKLLGPLDEFDQKRTVSKSSHRPQRVLIAVDDVQNFSMSPTAKAQKRNEDRATGQQQHKTKPKKVQSKPKTVILTENRTSHIKHEDGTSSWRANITVKNRFDLLQDKDQ